MRGPYKFFFPYNFFSFFLFSFFSLQVLFSLHPPRHIPCLYIFPIFGKIFVSGKLIPLFSVNWNSWGKEEVRNAVILFFKSKGFDKLMSHKFPKDVFQNPAWVGWTATCPPIAARQWHLLEESDSQEVSTTPSSIWILCCNLPVFVFLLCLEISRGDPDRQQEPGEKLF